MKPNISNTKSVAKVVLVDDTSKKTLQLKLYLKINGVYKEIKFPFSIEDDTAEEVAREMAQELSSANNQLTDEDCQMIANAIHETCK